MARTANDSAVAVREAIKNYATPMSYGVASAVATLAIDLRKVAALIHTGFSTRIYYVSLSGFDTHANQGGTQSQLLMYVADALEGFLKDLTRLGRASQIAEVYGCFTKGFDTADLCEARVLLVECSSGG
jgi:uncharacterized protein (DUF1501 family)